LIYLNRMMMHGLENITPPFVYIKTDDVRKTKY